MGSRNRQGLRGGPSGGGDILDYFVGVGPLTTQSSADAPHLASSDSGFRSTALHKPSE